MILKIRWFCILMHFKCERITLISTWPTWKFITSHKIFHPLHIWWILWCSEVEFWSWKYVQSQYKTVKCPFSPTKNHFFKACAFSEHTAMLTGVRSSQPIRVKNLVGFVSGDIRQYHIAPIRAWWRVTVSRVTFWNTVKHSLFVFYINTSCQCASDSFLWILMLSCFVYATQNVGKTLFLSCRNRFLNFFPHCHFSFLVAIFGERWKKYLEILFDYMIFPHEYVN